MLLKKIKLYYILFIISILSCLIFSGCNDKPTILGYSFLSDTISLYQVTSHDRTLMDRTQSEYKRLALFQTGCIFVGNYHDTKNNDDWHAISLIRLSNLLDTLNYIKASSIISATLYVYPSLYIVGDTNSCRLSFNVYRASRLWTNKTSWDSVQNSGENYYNKNYLIGSVDQLYKPTDTITPLAISISPSEVEYWSRLLNDSITKRSNFGLTLVPNSDCNAIYKFYGQMIGEDNPYIYCQVYFINRWGSYDSVTIERGYEESVVYAPVPDTSSLIFQGGASYISKIWFDIPSLPDLTGIHVAELYLYLDSNKSVYGNNGPDSLIMLELFPDTSADVSPKTTFTGYRVGHTNQYKFESISWAIEYWNRKGITNCFLVLKAAKTTYEYQALDRMVFYGLNEPDTTLRPELRLVYSKRPIFKR